MKSVQTTKTGKNFTAVNVGKLSEIKDYVLPLGDIQIPGKVFVGQALGTTGSELSFQSFAPGQDGGFLHTHKTHEELYFILKGEGLYQVDGENISVSEGGSAPGGARGWRSVDAAATEEKLMLCVQYKGNAFTADDAADGEILSDELKW